MRFHGTKWVAAVATLATSALVLTACGGGGTSGTSAESGAAPATGSESTGNGTITAAVAYETTNYNPSTTSSALALGANWHVMEGLYELDMHTFAPYTALAAGDPVEVSDTVYEISLRDGAAFSDGTPVTADDVVESYARTTAEDNLYVSMLSFLESITKKDDQTVTVSLKYPFSLLKERLSLIKVIPASMSADDLTAKPVGTGPWMYQSIDEQKVVFAPNPNYTGEHPAKADSMEWSIIKDDTARTTAMQEGTIQVMESVPADVADQLAAGGVTVEAVQGFNLPFLMFNTKKAPLDNEKVRQAFFYAIDTDKLIDNAMSGNATAATSFLPKEHANYNEASTVFTYDPEKAKSLLAEAGQSSMSISLLTTDHPWITALAPQIQNDLKAVGIDATITSEASSSLYANNTDVDSPTFDVVLAPGDPSVFGNDPDLLMNWWYGDNTWTQKRTQWKDSPAYTELHTYMDAAVRAQGSAQQDEWNKAFDLISEQVPLYPLFHRKVVTGYLPGQLDGYSPISTTGLSFIDTATK